MAKDRKTINVQGAAINVLARGPEDYICLTDMAKKFGDDSLIYNWMRNRNTLEFLGIWEQMHNPDFKGGGFETFKKEAGLNSFHLTPRKWIDATQAIGVQSRAGRYGGGTYAHIRMGMPQAERLLRLNEIAIRQLQSLSANGGAKLLRGDAGDAK
jgi:hypothetical protein